MTTFVTSNLQLGRPSVMKTYKRDFENVDAMDTYLINKWNSVVKAEDVVYHLGNFAWDPKTAADSLLRLNGTIKFIIGEHDKALLTLADKNILRAGVFVLKDIEVDVALKSVLSYWPLGAWPNKSKKYYSIVGFPGKNFKSNPANRVINVSTDLWGNTPQELERIIEIFKDI